MLTAQTIGTLMEAIYFETSSILGPPRNTAPRLAVHNFSTRKIYEEQVQKLGLPGGLTTGFYSPAPPSGIYLPLVKTSGTHPFFTFVHEGLHQYIHEELGYVLHNNIESKFPPLPLWLNEGLALYLEAALVDDSQLKPGRIHPARLFHLQKLIRQGKAPAVANVLSTTYGERFSNADYSVSWGLVQALRDRSSGLSWETFWQAWQSATAAEFESFQSRSIGLGAKDCQHAWADVLRRQSTLIFQEHILLNNQTWDSWEDTWRGYILELTPDP